jgi:hypothetical protein
MFKKKQKTIPAVAAATVAVISDDLTAIKEQAKKTAKRKSKKAANDRLAQAVTVLACVMAAAYIAIRIFNWIRFI